MMARKRLRDTTSAATEICRSVSSLRTTAMCLVAWRLEKYKNKLHSASSPEGPGLTVVVV